QPGEAGSKIVRDGGDREEGMGGEALGPPRRSAPAEPFPKRVLSTCRQSAEIPSCPAACKTFTTNTALHAPGELAVFRILVPLHQRATYTPAKHNEEVKGCCGYREELDACRLTEGLGTVPGEEVEDQQQGLLLIQ
ncbi:hypothetical protein KUCAC02_035341, partial [Chaenocephalus aceratus]